MRFTIKNIISYNLVFLAFTLISIQSFAADYYWKKVPGNPANFNDTRNWTTSDTGEGADVTTNPTSIDNIYFPDYITGPVSIGLASAVNIRNLTCTSPSMITFTGSSALTISGSIQLNGNLQITGNLAVTMRESEDVTIDLGTNGQVQFGNSFTINKSAGSRVELTGHHFNLVTSSTSAAKFTIGTCVFYSNDFNMTVPHITCSGSGIIDLKDIHLVPHFFDLYSWRRDYNIRLGVEVL